MKKGINLELEFTLVGNATFRGKGLHKGQDSVSASGHDA